jgi:hypothetical protein
LTFDGSVGKSRNKKVFGKREKRERKIMKETVKKERGPFQMDRERKEI